MYPTSKEVDRSGMGADVPERGVDVAGQGEDRLVGTRCLLAQDLGYDWSQWRYSGRTILDPSVAAFTEAPSGYERS